MIHEDFSVHTNDQLESDVDVYGLLEHDSLAQTQADLMDGSAAATLLFALWPLETSLLKLKE